MMLILLLAWSQNVDSFKEAHLTVVLHQTPSMSLFSGGLPLYVDTVRSLTSSSSMPVLPTAPFATSGRVDQLRL